MVVADIGNAFLAVRLQVPVGIVAVAAGGKAADTVEPVACITFIGVGTEAPFSANYCKG